MLAKLSERLLHRGDEWLYQAGFPGGSQGLRDALVEAYRLSML